MKDLLWLYDELAVMLGSPITLVTIAWAFGLGLWRGSWWLPAAVAVVAVVASTLVLQGHWQRLGIDIQAQIWQGSYLFAIFAYSSFGIARLLIFLLHKIEPKPRFDPDDGENSD